MKYVVHLSNAGTHALFIDDHLLFAGSRDAVLDACDTLRTVAPQAIFRQLHVDVAGDDLRGVYRRHKGDLTAWSDWHTSPMDAIRQCAELNNVTALLDRAMQGVPGWYGQGMNLLDVLEQIKAATCISTRRNAEGLWSAKLLNE